MVVLKPFAWLIAWSLYWIADLISRTWIDEYVGGFNLYQRLMDISYKLQGKFELRGPWERPFGREPSKNYVLGYMCAVDWQCEIGGAEGGNTVYASPKDCAARRKCTDSCGIVEVRVYFNKWVKEQNLFGEENEQ